jgi:hypothetical protein
MGWRLCVMRLRWWQENVDVGAAATCLQTNVNFRVASIGHDGLQRPTSRCCNTRWPAMCRCVCLNMRVYTITHVPGVCPAGVWSLQTQPSGPSLQGTCCCTPSLLTPHHQLGVYVSMTRYQHQLQQERREAGSVFVGVCSTRVDCVPACTSE